MSKNRVVWHCEECGAEVPWVVQVESKWVGPCHVPEERWAMYPGWREREALRVRRAELARSNFHKEAAAA